MFIVYMKLQNQPEIDRQKSIIYNFLYKMESRIHNATWISKLHIKGTNFYIRLLWEDNENDLFRLNVFDGNHSWSGRFSTEFAESCRSLVDETVEEYKNNVRNCFSSEQNNYTYDFTLLPDDESAAVLSWKKVFDDYTVMVHGKVQVHIDNVNESKDTLIDFLTYENKELRESIEAHNKKNQALSKNLEECKQEVEEVKNMMTSLESSLYGKFVQLLNEKKRKIWLLEQAIQNV